MTSHTSVSTDDHLNLPSQYIRVTNWPVRDEPAQLLVTASLFFLVALIVGRATHSYSIGLMCLLAIYASMWRSWLPITYEFDLAGVIRTIGPFQTRIPWDSIGDWHTTGNCMVLHRRRNPGPIDTLVAQYVQAGDDQQLQEIVNTVAYHVAPRIVRASSTVTREMRDDV